MLDAQTSELEFAAEIGMRVIKLTAEDRVSYQFQRVNSKGTTVSVTPTQAHSYMLWKTLVATARQLGAALEGGKEGDGAEPGKSPAPHVA